MATLPAKPPLRPFAEVPTLITPDTAKFKFKFFFHWRKASTFLPRPSTGSAIEKTTIVSGSEQQASRPQPSPRSFSFNPQRDEPLNVRVQCDARRDKVLADPPPYAQAQPWAILHADLETPASFIEKPRSRAHNDQSKDSLASDLLDDTVEVKKSHRRTESGQSTCTVRSKHFFLINGPYILQYDSDAEGSTLPQKILVLRRDSVAFASDAVPGHPWVLQVSRATSAPGRVTTPTLRPSWSRLTLRQTENKRLASTLLLVFNESDELYTWLYAIRKEIEDLGGVQSRPNANHNDKAWRDSLTRKFGSATEASSTMQHPPLQQSRSPSGSPRESTAIRPTTSHAAQGYRPESQQSSDSFKITSALASRPRTSVPSSAQSSRPATSNGEINSTTTSPSGHRTSVTSSSGSSTGHLLLRGYSDISPSTSTRSSTVPTPRGSILDRRNLSVGSLQLPTQDIRARKCPLSLPSTITVSPTDNSATLPTSPPSKSPLREVTVATESPIVDLTALDEIATVAGPAAGVSSITVPPKPKYSLFPTTKISETKPELPVLSAPPLVTTTPAPAVARPHTSKGSISNEKQQKLLKSHGKASVQLDHQRTRSRTVTLELRQHRFSTLLGVGDDMPQRSPAVTHDMIMSGFGLQYSSSPTSPLPVVPVPNLANLNLDLGFLRSEYKPEPRKTSVASERKSSLRKNSAGSIFEAPTGPPPSGPLPAVPAIPAGSRRSSRTTRSSQYSQSSQLSHTSSMTSFSHTSVGSKSMRRESGDTKPKVSEVEVPFSLSRIIFPESSESTATRRHRRTISNAADGPPLPARVSLNSTSVDRTPKPRSRSRKRA